MMWKPHHNDVLMGRGGKNNAHVGNKQLRQFARELGLSYYHCPRLKKEGIYKELVKRIKQLDPPGRFLRQDKLTLLWVEVGEKEEWSKASQHLRDAAKDYEKTLFRSPMHELAKVFDISEETHSNAVEVTPPSNRRRILRTFDAIDDISLIDLDSDVQRIIDDDDSIFEGYCSY